MNQNVIDILKDFYMFMDEDGFSNDREINDYLDANLFQNQNQEQIRLVCDEIALKYKGHSFLKDSIHFSVDTDNALDLIQENENYIEIYHVARQNQNYKEIFEKMKYEEFNRQNNIPSLLISKKTSIQNLNNQQIKLIFDLNEYNQNLRDLSQIELIKIMLTFLNENVQDDILSLIGSLFLKQKEHFENYLSWIKGNDLKQFEEFVNNLQNYQQGNCDLQVSFPTQSIDFLKDLLSLKLVKDKQSLSQYIMKSINVKQDQCKDCLQYFESSSCCKENLDQIYFALIFFFWIKYTNILLEFKDGLDKALKKASDKKKTFEFKLNTFLKTKSLDEIHIYLIHKVISFQDANKPYEDKSDENLKKLSQQIFSKFSNNYDDGQQNQINNEDVEEFQFIQYWKQLQKLQFYQIQFMTGSNAASELFQSILFTNKLELSTQTSCEIEQGSKIVFKIYQSLPKNEEEFQKFINELEKYNQKLEQSRPQFILDILELVTHYNKNLIFNVSTYKRWYEITKSFDFQKNSFFCELKNIHNLFKIESNQRLSLIEFNVPLINKCTEKHIQEWINQPNSREKFVKLVPAFFDIIKRGQSFNYLVKCINNINDDKNNQSQYINAKALFQIFYNNCENDLQVLILQLHSQYYPIPFLYQNPNIQNAQNIMDLYELNTNLYFLIDKHYSILNFSLSQQQKKIGKTQLINSIFYQQQDNFQIGDNYLFNENTIDIKFDFPFQDSRNFLIADAHGHIEMSIFLKILPFFKCWIIQMDTENEIQENLEALEKLHTVLQSDIKIQDYLILFLVRNQKENCKDHNHDEIMKKNLIGIKYFYLENLMLIQNQQQKDQINDNLSKKIINAINQHVQDIKNHITKQDFYILAQQFNQQMIQYQTSDSILNQAEIEMKKFHNDLEGYFSKEAFPIRHIDESVKEIRQNEIKEIEKNDMKKANEYQKQIQLKQQEIQNLPNSTLCDIFSRVISSKNYTLYMQFISQLTKINKENMINLNQQIQKINNQLQENKTEQLQKEKNQLEIKQIKQSIGIEIFWRESIKRSFLSQQTQVIADIVFDLLKKGEPFEFLDGDLLKINSEFLEILAQKLSFNNRIMVLSILGPQSTGKSTLLNKIFGCHFLTSVGRCTKGIFMQLLPIHDDSLKKTIDYILLLDSEGLQNPNIKDREFDKKVALFILAISNIIIVNVKGEMTAQFKNLVELCTYSLDEISKAMESKKKISWCFNQNQATNNDKSKLLEQLKEIIEKIESNSKTMNEYKKLSNQTDENHEKKYISLSDNIQKVCDINENNIYILGVSELRLKNQYQSQWEYIQLNREFSINAEQKGKEILISFFESKTQDNFSGLLSIFQKASDMWKSISIFPDLKEYSEIQEMQDNLKLQIEFQKQMKVNRENLSDPQNPLSEQAIKNKMLEQIKNEKIQSKNQDQKQKSLDNLQDKFNDNIESQLLEKSKQIEEELKAFSNLQDPPINKQIQEKFLKKLKNEFSALKAEIQLNIVTIIQVEKIKYQKQSGYPLIRNYLKQLTEDQIQEFKENRLKIQSEFDGLWKQCEDNFIIIQRSQFEETQKILFTIFSSSYPEYCILNENEEHFKRQLLEMQEQDGSEQDAKKITEIFKSEFEDNQFQVLNLEQKNQRYLNEYFFIKRHKKIQQISDSLINLYQDKQQTKNYNFIDRILSSEDYKNSFQKVFYQFKQEFKEIINNETNEGRGWYIIYEKIFEYIKTEVEMNQIGLNSIEKIGQIMRKLTYDFIDKSINENFALYGFILSDIGKRWIQYFCILLIWTLVGRKAWKNLKAFIALDQEKQREFNNFESTIEKNLQKAIKENAKELFEKFKCDFEENYYNYDQLFQIQLEQLPKDEEVETSREYILRLDNEYRQYIDQDENNRKILIEYIQHQKEFIEKKVKDEINQIKKKHFKSLKIDYQEKFRYHFQQILFRARKFYDETKQFISDDIKYIYNHTYVQKYDQKQFNQSDKQNQYFNQPILKILIFYLLGYNTQSLNEFKDIDEQYQNSLTNEDSQNKQKFEYDYGKYKIEILNLKSFIDEFQNKITSDLENSTFQINEQNILFLNRYKPIQARLDSIQIKKIGCIQVCPNCNRKCDNDDFKNEKHKHYCKSGHQFKGFSDILINDYPSLFTCEQMEDLQIQQRNGKFFTWKELKENYYHDWSFGCEVLQEQQKRQEKYWYYGLGQFFCKDLNQRKGITIEFKDKTPEQKLDNAKNIFYIFMLDDSGSMEGSKWNKQIQGVKATFKILEQNPLAKVSVIVFNSKSRLVIENQKVDSDDSTKIKFQDGGTDFQYPFEMALEQILKYGYNNEEIVLMFYTDGDASYPQNAMDQYKNLDPNLIKICKLNILCEQESKTLQQIYQTLSSQYNTTFIPNVEATYIEKLICETVCKK